MGHLPVELRLITAFLTCMILIAAVAWVLRRLAGAPKFGSLKSGVSVPGSDQQLVEQIDVTYRPPSIAKILLCVAALFAGFMVVMRLEMTPVFSLALAMLVIFMVARLARWLFAPPIA